MKWSWRSPTPNGCTFFTRSAGVPESQYGDGLNGTQNRHYSVLWLWAQSDLFILKFVERLMEARSLTAENKRAVRAFRMLELIKLLTEDA